MEQDKTLTGEQSLEIITKMISTAKGNMKASSFFFLFWGWIVVFASIGHFYLDYFTVYAHPYIVWLVGIPGWIITMLYAYRQANKKRVKTYSDSLIMWTWIGFGFCILIVIFGGSHFGYRITSLIMLFSGLATFINGLIIRFKPLIIGGSSFWIFTPIALVLGIEFAPLVMAVAVIIGYLIPGYMLKKAK